MKVTLPSALRSLRSITAAELKAMYQAIATVVNGNLSAENFGKHLRIPSAMKAEPMGIGVVTLYADEWTGGAGDDFLDFMVPYDDCRLVAWSIVAGKANALTASTIQMGYRTDPLDTNRVVLDSGSLTAVTATAPFPDHGAVSRTPAASCSACWTLSRALSPEPTLPAGSHVYVYPSVLTMTSGKLESVFASIWLRSPHLP